MQILSEAHTHLQAISCLRSLQRSFYKITKRRKPGGEQGNLKVADAGTVYLICSAN